MPPTETKLKVFEPLFFFAVLLRLFHPSYNKLRASSSGSMSSARITSTLIYTHLVNFESDEYHTATAKTLKEDEDLLKAGFEYVTERDEVKIYR
jgi:hypothetical protein